jgi:hypothetical protein
MSLALQSEIVTRAIAALPPEKARELVDFAIFLQQHYGKPSQVEYDDTWTEEDMRAFSRASMLYFDSVHPENEGYDDVQTG